MQETGRDTQEISRDVGDRQRRTGDEQRRMCVLTTRDEQRHIRTNRLIDRKLKTGKDKQRRTHKD